MSISDLPAVNASLNFLASILLTAGYVQIKRKRVEAHRACMIAAFVTSTIFLVFYLIYHANVGHTSFDKTHWFRPYYLLLLLTHVVLAAAIVPMILMTFYRAFKGQEEKHRKIARWTWPLWMYVSVTGVVIYLLLYHIFPQR